jgi:hypothetical protein
VETVAARPDVECLLSKCGLAILEMGDPPAWGEVAAVFAPLLEANLKC